MPQCMATAPITHTLACSLLRGHGTTVLRSGLIFPSWSLSIPKLYLWSTWHPFLLPNPAFSFLITEGNRTWSSGVGLSCQCAITSPLRSSDNPEQITEPSNLQCSHLPNGHKDGTYIYMSGTEKVFKKWWLPLSLPLLLPNRMVHISYPLESKFSWC